MAEFKKTITVNCPHCNSPKVIKKGTRNGYQTYHCKDCDRRFNTIGNAFGSWNKIEHIGAAVDMYHSGMSYKQIAEILERNFGIPEPSKHTIHRWVKEYSEFAKIIVNLHAPETSGHWVADEMQLKVGGKRMWNWNVMDFDTRYVLASHLSPYRGEKDAIAVFEKATRANGGVPPKTITTDGLGSYDAAISLIFPYTRHFVAPSIYDIVNNNRSERMQGTFRQRTKVMRGLQSRRIRAGHPGWFRNRLQPVPRPRGTKGGTPAQAARLGANLNRWTDIVEVVNEFKAESSAANAAAKARKKAEAKTVNEHPPKQTKSGRRGSQNGRGKTEMRATTR